MQPTRRVSLAGARLIWRRWASMFKTFATACFCLLLAACATRRADPIVVSVMERQVAAYNQRNLEAFVALFADDATLYAYPDEVLLQGKTALRAAYGKLFAEAHSLRAVVHERIIQGRYAIDQETTMGMPGKPDATGVAIYEINNGLITRVWFLD
jgi:uncharacterized protein (TIGR02246 family)